MTQSAAVPVHPVDERLPLPKLFTLGLQHVLVMYAGAVAVPLIIGGALKMSVDQIAFLINADLFACGIATLIQTLGLWIFGLRLPIMMGVTFTAVTPMIAIGTNPELGLLDIYGATIAAGVIGIFIAPFIGKLLRLFPPVVTGTVITVIGISLMGVGINWAAGGFGNPDYGNPLYLGVSFAVLIFILLITRFVKGFFSNIAVLLGILFGFAIALMLHKVNFDGLDQVKWFDVVLPFHFGMPVFDPWAIVTLTIVMLITFIESTGMFLALGEIVGKPVDEKALVAGLRVDGLGTVIGGVFNTFPHTSFSQNIGLVGVTGVKSRWVCAAAGVILLVFGLIPKMSVVVASIPQFVLGGAGVVMFGMVLATGIKILMGAERRSMVMTEEERKNTAYHESGHAVVAKLLPKSDPVHKVTIIPRGRALGVTMQLPEQDRYAYDRVYLMSRIAVLFGGRIAEELFMNQMTTGASNDFERATQMARDMVTRYGMSDALGPMVYGENEGEVFLGRSITTHKNVSEATMQKVDAEIRRIIDEQFALARRLLEENRDKVEAMTAALLEWETIDAEQIDAIMAGNQPRPPKQQNVTPPSTPDSPTGTAPSAPAPAA